MPRLVTAAESLEGVVARIFVLRQPAEVAAVASVARPVVGGSVAAGDASVADTAPSASVAHAVCRSAALQVRTGPAL